MDTHTCINEFYRVLAEALGPSRWWPGEHAFEIALGAILTQNTNWRNVEHAIANLKACISLTPAALAALSRAKTEELIRPAGYFRLKTARLGSFLQWLTRAAPDHSALEDPTLSWLQDVPDRQLRLDLLSVKGIGPETADSILLYALDRPEFVVDAYTARIAGRHGLIPEEAGYDEIKEVFTAHLPRETGLFNEYHALIVRTAKTWCRKKDPLCDECPLGPFLD